MRSCGILRVVVFAGLVGSGSIMAGCGGGGGTAKGGEGEAPAAKADAAGPVDACSLVTQADAEELFGRPAVREKGTPSFSGMLLGDCLWTWDTESSNQLLQLHVWKDRKLTPPADAQPLDLGEGGSARVHPVAGVDIEWRQDGKVLTLSYSTLGPDAPKAPDKADAVRGLARKAAGRL
jgi:hypothetical protein